MNFHLILVSSNWHTRPRDTRYEFIFSSVADEVSIHKLSIDFHRFLVDLHTLHQFPSIYELSIVFGDHLS